jgi:hypothetical protein
VSLSASSVPLVVVSHESTVLEPGVQVYVATEEVGREAENDRPSTVTWNVDDSLVADCTGADLPLLAAAGTEATVIARTETTTILASWPKCRVKSSLPLRRSQ